MKVAELCSVSGGWNSSFIRSHFSPLDAAAILSLPSPSFSSPDRLIWHFNKDGLFSVKSCYWLAQESDTANCSNSAELHAWWRFFWKLQVPAKIKKILWRVCHNGLPTAANLLNRKIILNPVCCCCQKEVETVQHALWWCCSLKIIRTACSFMANVTNVQQLSMFDFLLTCKQTISCADFQLLCVVLWKVWHRHHNLVHHRPCFKAEDIVPWCSTYLADYHTANQVTHVRVDRLCDGSPPLNSLR
ncbi:hypothetical protein ACOSQ3_016711 [Xanthoceras sorbifolium]